ncbi:hypothetical protein BJV82DRAFT_523413 [Fennellomyces sp. T-0311]|nr:hypothetical protein BJV82DRAFT_523413 [Fennellomyces sp. T-0311]
MAILRGVRNNNSNNKSKSNNTPSRRITADITSSSTNTTATDNVKKLNAEDMEKVKATYKKMEEGEMWRLSTGKLVEREMEKVALAIDTEHPAHSVILDPTASVWATHFTKEELVEIRGLKQPEIATLTPPLEELIASFDGKAIQDTLDDIYHHVRTMKYHPQQQPDLHWVQLAVEEALVVLYSKYLGKSRTETDLVNRVWGFLGSCFDFSEDIVSNSGERASKAASEGQNQERVSGTVALSERKKVGIKVDLLFSSQLFELGAMEAGASNDRSSSKSLFELNIKCPKALKDVLSEMERTNPAQIHNFKTCGFVISGLYLQYIVVDCPAGHVCRVTKLPDWLPYPVSEASFVADFFPLLQTAWAAKKLMEETKKAVEKKKPKRVSFTAPMSRFLQRSFTHSSLKSIPKKRKANSQAPAPTPSSSASSSSSA